MAAHAISGVLYIGAITSATGTSGTRIDEVSAREIPITLGLNSYRFRSGRERDNVATHFSALGPAMIAIRARDVDANTINFIFSGLSTSGGLRTSGSGVETELESAPSTAIIIRPNSTGQNYFYAPSAVIVGPSTQTFRYGIASELLLDNEVLFGFDKASGNTEPAAAWDTAANINSLFAGLS